MRAAHIRVVHSGHNRLTPGKVVVCVPTMRKQPLPPSEWVLRSAPPFLMILELSRP